MKWSRLLLVLVLLLLPRALRAQNPEGVRLGLLYQPEYQPGLVVLPFAADPTIEGAATAIRAIIEQDLGFSDRFQIRDPGNVMAGDSVNLALWKQRGADYVLDGALTAGPGGVSLRLTLHDAVYGQIKDDRVFQLPLEGNPGFRMAVHAVSDRMVTWVTGDPGMAASRIAFVLKGQEGKDIYIVDSDGENVQRVTTGNTIALSPAWSPDGQKIAYMSFKTDRPVIYERDLRTGTDRVLSAREGLNATPAYSPDGQTLAFATTVAGNTEIATLNIAKDCCLAQQTRGNHFDSLSPTFSPDGSEIAFVSNRLGEPQIYIMSLGTGASRLISDFTYGERGYNTSPAWSPTGQQVAYHSRINGVHQIMVADLETGTRRLLTNEWNNEDPSWAPDGRHIVFSSTNREGGGLFVLDTVSGRIRPLLRGGSYGLPDWSGPLSRASGDARAVSGGR